MAEPSNPGDQSAQNPTFSNGHTQPAPAIDVSSNGDAKRSTRLVSSPAPKCVSCGHVNRVGALICENCGTSLVAGEHSIVGTKRFQKNADGTLIEEAAESEKLSSTELRAVQSAGSADFQPTMILRLEVEGSSTPLLVFPKGEIALGRRDPATGTMPEVDLTAFAAYRMGVSRRHAVIKLNGTKLEIYDLGSSNGTAVNGLKLVSHQPHVLRDGDSITLGKMTMRAMFQQPRRQEPEEED